jgi:hypothetical protein
MVASLPNKEFRYVDLDLAPSPQEVPTISQIQAMRQLVPPLFFVQRPGDDIIDFSFVLNNPKIQRGAAFRLFRLIFLVFNLSTSMLDNFIDIFAFKVLKTLFELLLCHGCHHQALLTLQIPHIHLRVG